MLSQTFTADNFREILDRENRKGKNLEPKFFPEVEKVTKKLNKIKLAFRELKKNRAKLLPDEYEKQRLALDEEKRQLKTMKEELLTKELERISSEIAAGNFGVTLETTTIRKKTAYKTAKDARSYFAFKQVLHNLNSVYDVKQSNRFEIISQLENLLGNTFPKYIIRTDVTEFYESIRHNDLLMRIDSDSRLTLPTRKVIWQVLKQYMKLSGSQTGVPRGIGISAYLAELYMQRFDIAIREHPEIIYYARYVDDMVMIFAPRPDSPVTEFLPFVEAKAAELGLQLNLGKTDKLDLTTPKISDLEYLGYEITFGQGSVAITLSDKTKNKYKKRVRNSFDAYLKGARLNEKKARRLLVKRIQFLTGNTRLLNNKHHVMIGIFYSNSKVSDPHTLADLDECLSKQISLVKSGPLRNRLGRFSFQDGFSQRRYQAFTIRELSQIVGLWEHEA